MSGALQKPAGWIARTVLYCDMDKILVSACLMGRPVRYDGGTKDLLHPALARWKAEDRLVITCPEMAGGLPVPRPPAEIAPEGSRVIDAAGTDVTRAFEEGARIALELALVAGCRFALLKENSPSCGTAEIYDGYFRGRRKPGDGMTAALLRRHGILCFGESEIEALITHVEGGGTLPG